MSLGNHKWATGLSAGVHYIQQPISAVLKVVCVISTALSWSANLFSVGKSLYRLSVWLGSTNT